MMSLATFPRLAFRQLFGDLWMRRHWLTRTSSNATDYLSDYWNSADHPIRQAVIEIVATELKRGGSLLEYGSHVGINIHMLKDREPYRESAMFAVEPNREAVDFMAANLPEIEILQAEDTKFVASDFPGRPIDVSLINCTFCAMSQKRTERVLDKLCRISNSIVIGDNLDNIHGPKSEYKVDPVHYRHPFKTMLQNRGFDVVAVTPSPEPRPHLNGFMVARKQRQ
ncbi:hypothetical protein ABIA99_004280 [Bradyrhizobium sp. LB12.1]|uniref:hypothetical protein n=1 Tax=Bradyrhizobium sp. LB12.1 TaxID=3156327 RepID=UPI003391FC1C